MPPLGYSTRAATGKARDVIVDEQRAPYIKQMFEMFAAGKSGRHIRLWLEDNHVLTRKDKHISLSRIYKMLKNPFYYGEFEYPKGSGQWYKGNHKALITNELFYKVQEALIVPQKSKWGAKEFPYKHFLKCYKCGSSIVGEEKFKTRKDGTKKRFVYYHCSRQIDYDCSELFATEAKITQELTNLSSQLINDGALLEPGLIREIEKFNNMMFATRAKLNKNVVISAYVRYVLTAGTDFEKTRLVRNLNVGLMLHNRCVVM